jgi:hypothetical protein
MSEYDDILQVQGINSKGFGTIPKLVMQDKRLTPQAKAIYAYFCSYAGAGRTAFPRMTKIIADLGMGKCSYYTHLNLLKQYGYLKAEQEKDKAGRFKRNLYTLVEVLPIPKKQDTVKTLSAPFPKIHETDNAVKPFPCFRETAEPNTATSTTNINNNKINIFKNNHVSQVQSATPDGRDKDGTDAIKQSPEQLARFIEDYTNWLYRKVQYTELAEARPYDINLIDEFIAVIVDTYFTEGYTVRIGGEDKPRALVMSYLHKLTYEDIDHAIDQFKGVSERISKKKQYILTLLYNCKMERDAHYTNQYQSEAWQ